MPITINTCANCGRTPNTSHGIFGESPHMYIGHQVFCGHGNCEREWPKEHTADFLAAVAGWNELNPAGVPSVLTERLLEYYTYEPLVVSDCIKCGAVPKLTIKTYGGDHDVDFNPRFECCTAPKHASWDVETAVYAWNEANMTPSSKEEVD